MNEWQTGIYMKEIGLKNNHKKTACISTDDFCDFLCIMQLMDWWCFKDQHIGHQIMVDAICEFYFESNVMQ